VCDCNVNKNPCSFVLKKSKDKKEVVKEKENISRVAFTYKFTISMFTNECKKEFNIQTTINTVSK